MGDRDQYGNYPYNQQLGNQQQYSQQYERPAFQYPQQQMQQSNQMMYYQLHQAQQPQFQVMNQQHSRPIHTQQIPHQQQQALYYQQLQQNPQLEPFQYQQMQLHQMPSQQMQVGQMSNQQIQIGQQIPLSMNQVHSQLNPPTPQMGQFGQQVHSQQPQMWSNGINPGFIDSASVSLTRLNSYSTFENTAHSNLNERNQFENVLNGYLIQRNSSIQRIPPIGHQQMDVFSIFHLVILEGGFDIVQKKGLWGTICPKVGLENTPQVHAIVATNYSTFLLALENMVLGSVKKDSSQVAPSSTVPIPHHQAMTPQIPSGLQQQAVGTSQLPSSMQQQVIGTSQLPASMQQQAIGSTIESELAESMKNAMAQAQATSLNPSPTIENNNMMQMAMQNALSNQMTQMQQQVLQSAMNQQTQNIQAQKMQNQIQMQNFSPVQSPTPVQQSVVSPPTMHPVEQSGIPSMHHQANPVEPLTEPVQPPVVLPIVSPSPTPTPVIKDVKQEAQQTLDVYVPKSVEVVDPFDGFEVKEQPVLKPEPTEEEKDLYFTRTRKLTSFGGVDLLALGPALQRMRASKEQYAPKDLREINQSLKSRQMLQIRFAVDTLSIHSSEYKLLFSEYPDLLDTLTEYMAELYCDLLPTMKRNPRFYTYRELFQMEYMTNHYFQDNSEPTVDENKKLHVLLTGIGLVLRNASLHPENQALMGQSIPLIHIAIKVLDFPVPEVTQKQFDNIDLIPCSLPVFTSLEHRKNGLIILSSLAQFITLPDQETCQLIVDVCRDFISELDVYYVYPAVDLLARLLLKQENLLLMSECNCILDLCENLLQLLPISGFTYETTPNQMAQFELVLMVLCNLAQTVNESLQQKISGLPGFLQIMRNCSRRPMAPPMFRPPPDLLNQFFAVRERAFKTYISFKRRFGDFKTLEKELIELMNRAHREGDHWIVTIIVEFLSDS